jgi:hypothetical protein
MHAHRFSIFGAEFNDEYSQPEVKNQGWPRPVYKFSKSDKESVRQH